MNFTEWAKQNPTKSLNDYYLEQQTLQAELQKTQQMTVYSEPKKNNSTLWTVLTVALSLVLGGFGLYALQKYNEADKKGVAPLGLSENKIVPIYTESEVRAKVQFEKDKTALENNWRDLITVKRRGGVQLGVAGGFKDVPIVVYNSTNYLIDEVTVLVTLNRGLLGNKACHTGILTFEDIQAGDFGSTLFSHLQCGQTLEVRVIGFKCKILDLEIKPNE